MEQEQPHGIPSHDTFGRVFAALDPVQFEACFRAWVAGVGERLGLDRADNGAGRVVARDGKTLRRSHDRGTAALHLVSAWASEARLVLAQRAVRAKVSEVGALPEVLALLALEGCIVTIDALGCHASIAQAIVAKEAEYVLALKDNQPRLCAEVQALFADAAAVAFREDESRVRQGQAAHNLALLGRIAVTLLQHEPTARCGLKAKRLKAGWDHRYLLQVLAS